MDRYSKSSEGIHQGSKIARNSFGPTTSTSTTNHSTQTDNEQVRFNNIQHTQHSQHSNMNGRGRGGPGAHGLRDELSMATKDKAVDQQLQNSQFYQRGLKANSATQSSNSNKGKSSKGNSSADNASMTMKNQQEMEDDEDDDGDRKLDPNMYDNVQYS